MDRAEPDGLRNVHEKAQGRGRGEEEHHSDQLGHGHPRQDAEHRAAFRPLVLPGTQVLADEGGQGHGHAHDGQEHQPLDLHIGAVSGHGVLAEGVDIALYHQVPDADDSVLHSCGQSLRQDLGEDLRIDAQLAEIQPGVVLHPAHPPQAHEEAASLGDDGGRRRSRHAPVEHCHEEQIQRHVQYGGGHEVVQRVEAVAQRLHDGHADVVEDDREHAAEIDAEIGQRVGQHRGRRMGQQQQLRHQQRPHHRREHRRGDPEQEIGVDGLRYVLFVPRSIVPGDDDAAAHSDTVEETDDEEGEVAAGADGGKGFVLGEIPQHPGVGQVVELLEELAEEHRQRKGKDAPDHRPLDQRRALGSGPLFDDRHDSHPSIHMKISRGSIPPRVGVSSRGRRGAREKCPSPADRGRTGFSGRSCNRSWL